MPVEGRQAEERVEEGARLLPKSVHGRGDGENGKTSSRQGSSYAMNTHIKGHSHH